MTDVQTEIPQVGTILRAPKTAELIASHLRRRIVKGELPVGETLPPEVHLMEQFGVSRPTLREAYRILETESLIGVRRGARGGAVVLEPDPMVAARHVGLLLQVQGTTVKDVYEARMVTEPVCAGMLAKGRTEDDLAALRAGIEQLRAIVAAGVDAIPDPATWARSTYRFHELILQRCGNKTLAVQGAVLADIVQTHLMQTIAKGISQFRESFGAYQDLIRSFEKYVELAEAQDPERAERHWREHMLAAGHYLFLHDESNRPLVDLFG